MSNEDAVLIVGAGPTGLVMALCLKQYGINVRIIDKNRYAESTSRAMVVQARTLELYAQLGIVEQFIKQGIQLEQLSFFKNGHCLKTVDIKNIGESQSPYPFILSLPQNTHELFLIQRLEELGVKVERNSELTHISQNNELVTVIINHLGIEENCSYRYVCACDGARSTIRQQLNINFSGVTAKQLFFVADVEIKEQFDKKLQIGINKQDFCLVFPLKNSNSVRFIGIIPELLINKNELQFEEVYSSFSESLRLHINQVRWFSTYHVHHRLIAHFREQNIFFAGDAAHIHSPVGGQGMNTGIGDAINLAWKLAGVLKNNFRESILQTYEMERQPFAKKLISSTDFAFQMIISKSFPGWFWRQIVFPYLLPFIFRFSFSKKFFFNFISQIQIAYPTSPLSLGKAGKLKGGDRLPWYQYQSIDNFKTLPRPTWQIQYFGTISPNLRLVIANIGLDYFNFPWTKIAKEKNFQNNTAYLIRPDGYLAVIDDSENIHLIRQFLENLAPI